MAAYAEATRQSQTAVIRDYIRSLAKELPAARKEPGPGRKATGSLIRASSP